MPTAPITAGPPSPAGPPAAGPNWQLRLPAGPLLRDGVPQALGGRALDVLLVLARAQSDVVPTAELLQQVWPDKPVEQGNLYLHISQLRKLLGHDAIRSVYGRGYQLLPQLLPAPGAATPPRAPPGREPSAVLYGREAEQQALRQALAEHALVSVVGMGGIGKSALVRSLASEPDAMAACIVELAALPADPADPADAADSAPDDETRVAPLAAAVLQALGVSAGSSPPMQRLLQACGQPDAAQPLPGLLVLDNCEHVLAGAAALVSALLAAAPALRIVTTSQVPLKLPNEHRLRLGPLALPAAPGLQAAQACGAVALFVSRTLALQPRFVLDDDNLPDVLDICRRLDGIPLALEFAAARMPLLGAQGVRQRLRDRFKLLTQGRAQAPSRHQTLQAAQDWSHELLPAREQLLLHRLSVFRGSFTADAAQQLASDDTLDEWAVLDALGRLVEHSFVTLHTAGPQQPASDAPRFMLLGTVRGHASRLLQARGDGLRLARRHAEIHAELARSHAGLVGGAQAGVQRDKLTLAHDNLRAALDWCSTHDPVLGLDIAASMGPFWRERGHHVEALQRAAVLLARTDPQAHAEARVRLLRQVAMVAMECGDAAQLRAAAGEVAQCSRLLGRRDIEDTAQTLLAHAATMEGDSAAARRHHEQTLAIRRELGDPRQLAEAMNNIACCLFEEKRLEDALSLLSQALPLAQRSGHRWTEAAVLESMGEVDFALQRFEQARRVFEANLAIQRELQHAYRTVYALQLLASAELRLQRPDATAAAAAALHEALSLGRQQGFAAKNMALLAATAECLLARGQPDTATVLLGALGRHGPESESALLRTERDHRNLALAQSHERLHEAVWQQRWFEGQRLTPEAAVALACAALKG